MRIHKHVIDLRSSSEEVKQITAIEIEPGVDVEVTIVNPKKAAPKPAPAPKSA